MSNRVNLLEGNITKGLIRLALPIMGSSFVQMAYSLIDTMWVGHLGSVSVAAVGVAGLFMWMAEGLAMIPQMGGEILTGQAIGEQNLPKAQRIAQDTMIFVIVMMLLYTVFVNVFHRQLIGFYHLRNPETIRYAMSYLCWVSIGFPLMGFNYSTAGILTATGNSRDPFRFNLIGMVCNILLDPVLIFGLGPFPHMGVRGAAIATMLSQCLVTACYIRYVRRDTYLFVPMDSKHKYASEHFYRAIARLGFPPALHSIGFAFITMAISRIIVPFGDSAIAVQQIGSQIESITWMTADGFAVAMNAFTAQNYGAQSIDRIRRGFRTAFWMMTVLGVITSSILFFGAGTIFQIFIEEPATIVEGMRYLRIEALSQVFMCYEMIATGAFGGMGRTRLPSYLGLTITALRVPFAILCSSLLGIVGVWWTISMDSVVRGASILVLFLIFLHQTSKNRKGEEWNG